MKRAILIIMLGVATALCVGRFQAQQPAAPAAPPPTKTKVGVINMVQLYTKCKRAADLKKQIEKEIEPFKAKKDKLEKLYVDWQNALKTNANLKPAEREQGFQVLKECKRQLEDLDMNIKTEMGPRFEKDTAALVDYIKKTVQAYSEHHGFHLVVAYGEPEGGLAPAAAFRQTVSSIDSGFTRAAFFPNSVDITNDLLAVLNSR